MPITFSTNSQGFHMSDSPSIDAFSRLRTCEPLTLFNSKQIADNQPLYFDDAQVSGSGTSSSFQTNKSCTRLSVTSATAGKRIRRTKQRFNYQPSKSHLIFITFNFNGIGTGITKRCGYYCEKNGIFFQSKDNDLYFVLRSYVTGSAVDNAIIQDDWNLDKLDGVTKSKITFNASKTHILVIDMQYLGVGRVRCGFDIDGQIVYCHEFLHANNESYVYMSNPNLPISYELINDGTGTSNLNMDCICSSVTSEGGQNFVGITMAISRESTALTITTTTNYHPLLAIRLNSSYLHSTIKIKDIQIHCPSGAFFICKLVLNPTIGGTALSFSQLTNSSIDYATPTVATTSTSGTDIYGFYVDTDKNISPNNGSYKDSNLLLGSKIDLTQDVLVLQIKGITIGASEDIYGCIVFEESY